MQTTAEDPAAKVQSMVDLRLAGESIETVIDFRDYLTPEPTLVMLAGRFRDDIRKQLGMPELPRAYRRAVVKPMASLDDKEFDQLFKAVGVLLVRQSPVGF
jgi:hypothetical protein